MAIYPAQSLLTLPVKSGSSPLLRPMAQLPGAKRSTSDTIIYASHHLASVESIFTHLANRSMQIYWNKRMHLHKKRVQLLGDLFATPIWLP